MEHDGVCEKITEEISESFINLNYFMHPIDKEDLMKRK